VPVTVPESSTEESVQSYDWTHTCAIGIGNCHVGFLPVSLSCSFLTIMHCGFKYLAFVGSVRMCVKRLWGFF